ncbi:MAG: helix-turn-helix transcriptional regulator [Synergistaceae bacterium]|nr:helix-turn-helix transcriptional regulator [Synergistaceae bacterium]
MGINDIASICKALSDVNRLQIVELLTSGEKCACELLEHFKITQPTLSHHMKVLSDCGLLHNRREGVKIFYALNCVTLTEFREFISGLNCNKIL